MSQWQGAHDPLLAKFKKSDIFFYIISFHCRVPENEWSFQDGGLYIIKKVGVKILTIVVLYRLY
jgi:hypothetical protein